MVQGLERRRLSLLEIKKSVRNETFFWCCGYEAYTILLSLDRFYSNGLDLQNGPSTVPHWFRDCFHKMLGRLLTFPVATIAAINGVRPSCFRLGALPKVMLNLEFDARQQQHAFAGGLTLALAHDYRILKNASGKGMLGLLSVSRAGTVDAQLIVTLHRRTSHAQSQ